MTKMTKVRKFATPFIAGFFSGQNFISTTVTDMPAANLFI
jgi:hypothetical protein